MKSCLMPQGFAGVSRFTASFITAKSPKPAQNGAQGKSQSTQKGRCRPLQPGGNLALGEGSEGAAQQLELCFFGGNVDFTGVTCWSVVRREGQRGAGALQVAEEPLLSPPVLQRMPQHFPKHIPAWRGRGKSCFMKAQPC